MPVNQISVNNLVKWQKGMSGNPQGQPRKYVSSLKHLGYKLVEINDCIQNLLGMDAEELQTVTDNEKATILEKLIAGALQKSLRGNDIEILEPLLSRVYGKPKQSVEVTTEQPQKQIIFNFYQSMVQLNEPNALESALTAAKQLGFEVTEQEILAIEIEAVEIEAKVIDPEVE